MKKNFQWKKTRYRAVQTTTRGVLAIIICLATIFTVYIGRKPYGEELKEGDISLRTIYAPIDFKYQIGVDEEKTEIARKEAMAAVEEIYEIEAQTIQNTNEKLDNFFAQIILVQNSKEIEENEKLKRIKEALGLELSDPDLKTFLSDVNPEETKNKIKTLLKRIFTKGIISGELENKIAESGQNYVVLKDIDGTEETKVSIERFSNMAKAKKEIAVDVQNLMPENRKLRIAAISLSELLLKPNVQFNEELTNQKRKLAYENAPLQYKEREVKKEELIIARGERVLREHLVKIKAIFRQQIKANRFMFFSGALMLTLIFLAIISIYLKSYEPRIYLSTRKLTAVAILFILILILAKIITYSPLPSYAIPTAIASILIAMLVSPRLAIIVTGILSILIGIIAGDKLNIAAVCFIGGVVGVFFIKGARRRSQILMTGCLVGLANFLTICAIELLHGLKYTVLLKEGFWGIINGLGSAVIITGILPVFEGLFNITTNISLLELSDLNHPLLKDMVFKAPGTYHHSLIVGNLAEAASEAIGANALLARVGSYFHDIGKTEKAEYFSENQIGTAKKKHDTLTPSMSSLIITNHVKDGVELARKYKLNQAVIDFIEQHHGTSLIYYFYQRALEKAEEELPKEEGFRYPGPKPQSKETAVVLLADSVEAASRTLADPTPARIKGLVRKIINNKFIDNQLDQCELTLKDLEVISDIFAHILMGIFHSRVEYEEKEKSGETLKSENKNKKQPKKNNHK
ncbi:MAG: HDIG domain-containing protein [Candidatus Omnitrophota bacterium]|nr:MAG: HDIG domain-containing protein [Candidatus Omnitrophota bacterium]